MEIYKDVVGYEGIYQVSNLGNVRSLDRYCKFKTGRKFYKGIQIKGHKPKDWYPTFIGCDLDGNRECLNVHRLVAEAFIPNPENKPQVNHIDGDKTNNKVDNLEWVTPKENAIHAYKNGLSKKFFGEDASQSKLTECNVIEIRRKYIPRKYTLKMLAKEFGVGVKTIHYIVRKETWSHI